MPLAGDAGRRKLIETSDVVPYIPGVMDGTSALPKGASATSTAVDARYTPNEVCSHGLAGIVKTASVSVRDAGIKPNRCEIGGRGSRRSANTCARSGPANPSSPTGGKSPRAGSSVIGVNVIARRIAPLVRP